MKRMNYVNYKKEIFMAKRLRQMLSLTAMLLVMLVTLATGNMGSIASAASSPAVSAPELQARYFYDNTLTADQKIDKVMANMTTSEKVGQLMMIGIYGPDVDDESLYLLDQFHFGGVVLFARNVESVEQVQKLTANLQNKRQDKLPLFIAIDEEGGTVSRLKSIMEENPSEQSIGETGNPENAREAAEKIANDLKTVGVNTNFAPVADVGDYPRSFGTDPEEVSQFVQQAADAYSANGVIYTLKHFPGIGKGKSDSHLGRVVVDASRAELMAEDIKPFKDVIQTVPQDGFMVMVTHVTYPELGSELPASIAKPIITDLLRKELGYNGIVISDDMEMGALSKYYDNKDVGVMAILAGTDIVMMCHDSRHQQELYRGIMDAVMDGRISQERLDASVRRVLRTKLQLAGKQPVGEPEVQGSRAD